VRRGSAVAKILGLLPGAPILSSENAGALIDEPRIKVFDATDQLCDADVLRALTDHRRARAVLQGVSGGMPMSFWRRSGLIEA
jgi:hypothetical protein